MENTFTASRNGARGADVAVLDTESNRVEVIDIATAAGTTTECVRVSPDGTRLYVGTNGPSGGQLVVVATGARTAAGPARGGDHSSRHKKSADRAKAKDGQNRLRVVGVIETGSAIRDVALSPSGAIGYVAGFSSEFGAVIDVIDTRTHEITSTRKIAEIGSLVTQLQISGDGDHAYLVSEDRVTVLCTLTHDVVGTVAVRQPSCVVESPDGNYLYIADQRGVVTVASVASTAASDIDYAVHETGATSDWDVPELLQYEAALA